MKWRSLEESTPGTDLRPLREVFAERKELIAKYVPREVQDAHARVVAELKAGGISERVLRVSDQAQAFELGDQNGKRVSSAELLAAAPLVICFIRGRWDPFCCGQMEAMNNVAAQIVEAGARLVAISPQTEKQSFFMADQHKLRFPLLSDPGNAVAREFGLVYRVPEYQQEVYRRAFVNLPLANGDETWELPIPAVFIVGRDGRVSWVMADPDYTVRAEPAEIMAAVLGLGG